jgi:hypothetical protein
MVSDLSFGPIPHEGSSGSTVCRGPLAVIPARDRTAYITSYYKGTSLALDQIVAEVTNALGHETLHLVLHDIQQDVASAWFDEDNHNLDLEIVLGWVRTPSYGSYLTSELS